MAYSDTVWANVISRNCSAVEQRQSHGCRVHFALLQGRY